MHDPVREAFVARVKAIDPMFTGSDLEGFWPALRDLVAVAPERADLSKKKSHYLASLAARSLARGDAGAAIAFLNYADRSLEARHLNAFLVRERVELRRSAEAASGPKRPRGRRPRR